MPIIKPSGTEDRVHRTIRIKKSLDKKLDKIMKETSESRTYVIESLLEFAIKEYEKEQKSPKKQK
jgi:predicted transcriptional regulator